MILLTSSSNRSFGCTNCHKLCRKCQKVTRKCPSCDFTFNTRCIACRRQITDENCACSSCGRVCLRCKSSNRSCLICHAVNSRRVERVSNAPRSRGVSIEDLMNSLFDPTSVNDRRVERASNGPIRHGMILFPSTSFLELMTDATPTPPKLTVKEIKDVGIMIPDEEDEAIVTVGEKLCVGCCERLPSTVIIDCGHVVYCIKCARRSLLEAISKLSCPICRKEIIHGITKIYI